MPQPQEIGGPDKAPVLNPRSLFRGYILDPNDGPIQSGRQAVQRFQLQDRNRLSLGDPGTPKVSEFIQPIDGEPTVEDEYSQNQLDAQHSHLGWPLTTSLPDKPWGVLNPIPRTSESERWATRRIVVQMWSVNLQVDQLSPADAFVKAVESALAFPDDASRTRAFEEVLASWGEVIPVAAIVGSTVAATGVLAPDLDFEPAPSFTDPPEETAVWDFSSFIDSVLKTEGKFERVLKYHITGSRPDILLREGLDHWIKNIKSTQAWEIIKVTRVVLITDILDLTLQQRIKALYANRNITFRTPPAGAPSQLEFESPVNHLYPIQRIDIGFSEERVESLSIVYANGLTVGPYGRSGDITRLDRFELAPGEFITDIFVWPIGKYITSVQLVKNTGYVSPIYGGTQSITQPGWRDKILDFVSTILQAIFSIWYTHTYEPPRLFTGNGKALAGLLGGGDATGITQLQAVWRSDLKASNYKSTHTAFAGSQYGDVWNDLSFIGDRFTGRISAITARSPGTGYLAGLRATYTSRVGGYPARQETPVRGTEGGPTTTWTLEEGEYIIGVRGRHDGTSVCEVQFTTNLLNRESPAFGIPHGNFSFYFPAPVTLEGKLPLHFMAGKSAERVNSILFVWADLDPSATVVESHFELQPGQIPSGLTIYE